MNESLRNKQKDSKKGKIYFISDAHLSLGCDPNERLLAKFLNKIKDEVSHLYIIGDLFDFWFEYRYAIPAAYLKTISALLNLTESGIKVVYLPGNHDFWMGDYLERQTGIILADEHLDIEHQGKKIHLTHGDGLAYGDNGYRILKKIFRFKLNIWLYKLLPVDLAYKLALKTSGASREYTSAKDKDLKGYHDYAEAKIKAGFDAVVMGHTHVPEMKKIHGGLYINTGDWIEHYSYVVLEDGEFKLESFN